MNEAWKSDRSPIIQVRDLHYRVRETLVLDGVSFEVWRGECFGIMGMSGAGKSTILKLLMG
ncbi:MAG: ATP-binding cassette domain-containing protein, partial [Armatimonadetes bacterium]|nr:ATP-binding cassette domain-containing protein [Armatimonadota bacterium]